MSRVDTGGRVSQVGLGIASTAVAIIATGVNHLAWFGWDPNASQWWQFAGFVVALGIVAYAFGRQGRYWSVAVGSGFMMFMAMWNFVGPREQMYVVAVWLVTVVTFAGTWGVAATVAHERREREHRQQKVPQPN